MRGNEMGKDSFFVMNSEMSDCKALSSRRHMEHRVLVRFVKLLDVAAVTAVFAWIWTKFYQNQVYGVPFYHWGNWAVIMLYAVLFFTLARVYRGFLLHLSRISELIYSQLLAAGITNALMYIVLYLLFRKLPAVPPMLLCLAMDLAVISIWTTAAHRWHSRYFAKKKTIIIYDEMEGLERLIQEHGLNMRYDVQDTVHVSRLTPDYMENRVAKIDVVFLCSLHSHDRNQILKFCVIHDVVSYVIPRIGDMIMSSAEEMNLMHLPMLLVHRYDPVPEYLFFKRLLDIVLSVLALVILSPLMIVLALLIRADGGTAFYRQTRLTKDGREFQVLKFRSMRMDAEKDGVARLSTGENDDRITKIGHFIRACRMDELPQLINILKGDMSIVGPRPERPEIAAQYRKELPEFDLRLQCKCGLTGLAQVYGKYNSTPYDKLLMDLMYIAKPSLTEDFRICFATIKILFMKESTEGVAEGQTTAEAGKPEIEESVGQESVRKTV